LLTPNSGNPICDFSVATPPGQVSWQDLLALKFEIPAQWQSGCSYLLNQRTLGLIAGMSDASGRPLMLQTRMLGQGSPGFTLLGSPILVVYQMPDYLPGATPIAYGNWKEAYLLVTRKALSMTPDRTRVHSVCSSASRRGSAMRTFAPMQPGFLY
jgi:HK97 family phage major capsid protein